MSLILEDYDLSGGESRSTSKITSATYINLQSLLGTVAGRVDVEVDCLQSTGDWRPLYDYDKDNNKKHIGYTTLDETEDGVNIAGLNGSLEVSVRVIPRGSASGTLSIDVDTDGTVSAIS